MSADQFLNCSVLSRVQQFVVSTWQERTTFMMVCSTFCSNGWEIPSFLFAKSHIARYNVKCHCIRCFIHRQTAKPAISGGARKVFELYARTVADGFCWYFAAV